MRMMWELEMGDAMTVHMRPTASTLRSVMISVRNRRERALTPPWLELWIYQYMRGDLADLGAAQTQKINYPPNTARGRGNEDRGI